MSQVLVIGGGGFIGGHLVRRLFADGVAISATHRPGAAIESLAGVRWIPTDLTLLGDAIAWPTACDTVVYLAQSRLWRSFPQGADNVFLVNVAGVFRAVQYAVAAGARRFVYVSTGSVYHHGDRPADEGQPFFVPGERAFYAAAKLSAETLLGPFASLLPVVVLRLFVPYGSGQASDMLLPRLVDSIRRGDAITLDGHDGLTLSPTAIADVIEALLRSFKLERSVTMNVAGPEVLSLREVSETIGRVIGRRPVFEERQARTVPVVAGTTARLRETLGWAPTRTLDQGLQDWLR